MLFYLSEELFDQSFSKDKQARVIRAVKNVLKSVYEGKHLVSADYSTIPVLREKITDVDCLSVLISLQNNYSCLNYDSIKYFAKIVSDENTMFIEEQDNNQILNLSIDYFQDSDITQSVIILCEDFSDAYFFEQISKYYLRKKAIGDISLRYEPDHGGGRVICRCFKKHIDNKNRFCLAFCDNDKKYPTDEIGDTLRDLEKVDRNGNFLCEYVCLEAQEIENLVPFNYLPHIKQRYHEKYGLFFIDQIRYSEQGELLKYYDIKKGVSKKQITNNDDYLSFVMSLLPFCENIADLDDLDSLDDREKIIPNTGKIIKPLMEKPSLFVDIAPDLLDYQKIEWKKIGEKFFYWTCARNAEAMNT